MKKGLVWCALLCLSLLVQMANGTDGAQIAKGICASCHNPDGNSVIPANPKLAGQHEGYLLAQLHELKKGSAGKRNNAIMASMLVNLSDDDLKGLAAYFSQQTMSPGGATKDLVASGQAIYRGGNLDKGVPACMACHGPSGAGNALARYPRLGGQHAEYIVQQLKNFRSGQRMDIIGGMMNDIAGKLSDDEMLAVASYISGLH